MSILSYEDYKKQMELKILRKKQKTAERNKRYYEKLKDLDDDYVCDICKSKIINTAFYIRQHKNTKRHITFSKIEEEKKNIDVLKDIATEECKDIKNIKLDIKSRMRNNEMQKTNIELLENENEKDNLENENEKDNLENENEKEKDNLENENDNLENENVKDNLENENVKDNIELLENVKDNKIINTSLILNNQLEKLNIKNSKIDKTIISNNQLETPIISNNQLEKETTILNSKIDKHDILNSDTEKTTISNNQLEKETTISNSDTDKTIISNSKIEKETTISNSKIDKTTISNNQLEKETTISNSDTDKTIISNSKIEKPIISNSKIEKPIISNNNINVKIIKDEEETNIFYPSFKHSLKHIYNIYIKNKGEDNKGELEEVLYSFKIIMGLIKDEDIKIKVTNNPFKEIIKHFKDDRRLSKIEYELTALFSWCYE